METKYQRKSKRIVEDDAFIFELTITEDGTDFTLPLYTTDAYTNNFVVDYGNGDIQPITSVFDSGKTTTYNIGTYIVKIQGTCQFFRFDNSGSKNLITKVINWGNIGVKYLNFYGCSNLTYLPTNGVSINRELISMSNGFRSTKISAIPSEIFNKCNYLTDLSSLCYGCSLLTSVGNIKTCSVTTMSTMFYGCVNFNQALSFDTSSVTNMAGMFNGCSIFNQALSFDTSSVTTMSTMFYGCANFNQALSFDTSSVTNMAGMFNGCTNFNQTLSFDTSSVTSMSTMFYDCTNFNQDISSWYVSLVADFTNFMSGVTLSTTNFDNLLVAWEQLDLINGLTVNFGNSTYTSIGETAKNQIISDDSWVFVDGGLAI